MTGKRLGFFTRLLDRASAAERYRLATAQIVEAERSGFDSAWVAQHHFHEDEGGLPSPFVFLAHVAAKTSRIRLGTGVVTLPMENAVRVAEDAIVLDLLSGGRFEFGVGSGGTPSAFLAFGETSAERGPVMGRNLSRIRDAWAGRPLGSPDNRLYPAAGSLDGRVWQATFSVEGGQRAGEAGDGLMLSRTQPRPKGSPRATLAEIQNPIIDAYLAALPPGRAPRIMGSRTLFVAESRERAWKLAEAGLRRSVAHFTATGFPPLGDRLEDIAATYDAHIGSPEDALAALAADTALARVTDLSFQVHSADPPHEDILRSIRLTASHVAPALGWRPEGANS
jgi:putative FMN-dependent luciferase-like monooxygenase